MKSGRTGQFSVTSDTTKPELSEWRNEIRDNGQPSLICETKWKL
jgi:hypothetical protein